MKPSKDFIFFGRFFHIRGMSKLSIFTIVIFLSCSMWEYDDLSIPYENEQPQTYLSLVASDTIYAHLDSTTGEFTYAIGERPPGDIVWDTLDYAFTTVFTSKQELHWWGEDMDGDIVGYNYKWSSESTLSLIHI